MEKLQVNFRHPYVGLGPDVGPDLLVNGRSYYGIGLLL